MASAQVPTLTGLKTADDAASNSSIAMRDASGGVYGVIVSASGSLRSSGGEYAGVSGTKTVSFTASDASRFFQCDAAAGTITATLPAAASSAGMRLTFKKITAANSLIIDGAGAETIDGAATKTCATQWAALTIYCDGVAWFIESTAVGTWT